jgi:hypothetical protein
VWTSSIDLKVHIPYTDPIMKKIYLTPAEWTGEREDEMNDLYEKIVDGKVGNVINKDDWDEEKDLGVHKGKYWSVEQEVADIDTFLKHRDLSNLTLYRSEGYRGVMCYSGWYEEDDDMYWLDVINDYMVYRVVEA